MAGFSIDRVEPKTVRNEIPGSIGKYRFNPGTLAVIMTGLEIPDTGDFDKAAQIAVDSIHPTVGRIAALALTLGPDNGELLSRPVEARLVTQLDLLEWILTGAKNIRETKKALRHIEPTTIPQGGVCTVGRDPSNHIVIPDIATYASRRHLTFAGYPDSLTRQFSRDYWLGTVAQGALPTDYTPVEGDRITQLHSENRFVVTNYITGAETEYPVVNNKNGSASIGRQFDS